MARSVAAAPVFYAISEDVVINVHHIVELNQLSGVVTIGMVNGSKHSFNGSIEDVMLDIYPDESKKTNDGFTKIAEAKDA